MHRILFAGLLALAATGCAGHYTYEDTNAAVDANPMCGSRPDNPHDPVSMDCERKTQGTWSSEPASKDQPTLDFSGKQGDD